jgi:hypothetical protein
MNEKSIREKMENLEQHLNLDADIIRIELFLAIAKMSKKKLYEYSLKNLEDNGCVVPYDTFRNAFLKSEKRKFQMKVQIRRNIIKILKNLIEGKISEFIAERKKEEERLRKKASDIRIRIDKNLYDDVKPYTKERALIHNTLDSDLDDSFYVKKNGKVDKVLPWNDIERVGEYILCKKQWEEREKNSKK